jgi:hypothetical protein
MNEKRPRERASEMVRRTISSDECRELKTSGQEGGRGYAP